MKKTSYVRAAALVLCALIICVCAACDGQPNVRPADPTPGGQTAPPETEAPAAPSGERDDIPERPKPPAASIYDDALRLPAYRPSLGEKCERLFEGYRPDFTPGNYGRIYPFVGEVFFTDPEYMFYTQSQNACGFADERGRIIQDAVYINVYPIYVYPSGGFAPGETAVIRAYAATRKPVGRDEASVVDIIAGDGSWAVLGRYSYAYDTGEAGIVVCIAEVTDGIHTQKYGLLGYDGIEKIPCTYEYMYFREGLAAVGSYGNDDYVFIDEYGAVVIDGNFYYASSFSEGLAAVQDSATRYGYIDKTGRTVIPLQYAWAEDFHGGFAVIMTAEGKYGVIDKTGAWALRPEYEHIYSPAEGIYMARPYSNVETSWYYFFIDGSPDLPYLTEERGKIYEMEVLGDGWFFSRARSGPDFEFTLSGHGKSHLFTEARSAYTAYANRLTGNLFTISTYAEQNGNYTYMSGVFDMGTETWVIELSENAQAYTDAMSGCLMMGKSVFAPYASGMTWGIYDMNLREILPPEFSMVISYGNVFSVRKGMYYGLIDMSGEWLLRLDLTRYFPD